MKKKFINGLLMALTIFGVTSSLVSCKDYDDEKIGAQQEQFFSMLGNEQGLREKLEGQVSTLTGRVDDLEKILKACRESCQKTKDSLAELYEKYALHEADSIEVWKEIERLNDELANYATIDTLGYYLLRDEFPEYLGEELGITSSGNSSLQEILNEYITNILSENIGTSDPTKDLKTQITEFITQLIDERLYISKSEVEQMLEAYVKNEDLSDFVKKGDLSDYVKKGELPDFSKYVTNEQLEEVRNLIKNCNCGYSDEHILELLKDYSKLTEEDIRKIILEYGYTTLSKEDVEKLLNDYSTLTEDQVNDIIASYQFNFVTLGDVQKLLVDYSKLTEEQVKTIIANYLTENNYLTEEQIKNLISTYGFTTLSKEEVEKMLENYSTLTEDRVKEIIESYDYITAEQLEEALRNMSTLTDEQVKGIVNEILGTKDYITEARAQELYNELYTKLNVEIVKVQNVANEALELAKGNKELIEQLQADFGVLNGNVTSLTGKVNTIEGDVETLKGNVVTLQTDLSDAIVGWNNSVKDLNHRIDSLALATFADSVRIDNLEKNYQDLSDKLDNVESSLNVRIDSILTIVVPELKSEIEDARTYAEQLKNEVVDMIKDVVSNVDSLEKATNKNINDVRSDLQKLEDAFNQYVKDNDAKVKDLQDRTAELEKQVADLSEKVEQIVSDVEKIKNALAKYISGITVNGTYNPAFGYVNTPLGVRSNVLIAYHGYIKNNGAFNFPGARPGYFVQESDYELIEDDMAFIKAANEIVPTAQDIISKDGEQGNAGKVYLTVNPANRDFTGIEPVLVTSTNYQSDVEMSPIRKSSDKLSFGWTRANSTENGFYESDVTIKKQGLWNGNVRLDLDIEGLKDVVKDLKNNWRSGISATKLATTLYENVSEVLDANAVKVEYDDDVTGKKLAVLSDYGVAATVLKPLSFSTLQGIGGDHVPGIGRIERLVDRLFNRIKVKLPKLNITIKELNLDNIEFKLTPKDTYTINYEISFDDDVTLNGLTINSEDFKITVPIMSATSFQTDANGNYALKGSEITKTVYEEYDEFGNGIESTASEVTTGYEAYIAHSQVSYVARDENGVWHAYDENDNILSVNYNGQKLDELVLIAMTYTEEQTVSPDDVTLDGKTVHLKFTVNYVDEETLKDIVNDIYGEVNDHMGDLNKMINDINEYIHDVVGQINKLEDQYYSYQDLIDDKIADFKKLAHKYIDRFNKRFAKYLTPNNYLQPFMVADTGKGYTRLTQAKSLPTKIAAGTIQLWPTTYNMDVLTPSYKKYVVCTKAWKDGVVNGAARTAFNSSNADYLNKVYYGEWKGIEAQIVKGYTYEILYMAVDFYGKVVANKYYVKAI